MRIAAFLALVVSLASAVISGTPPNPVDGAEPQPLEILFLGDDGHHQPFDRFLQLEPVLAARGIRLSYTARTSDLNAANLARHDGIVIYANHTRWSKAEESALLDYVASGKGFIPLHSASYCFIESPDYVELVGAQFQRHGTGTFRVESVLPEHPILRGYGGFESWDETYVHTKHNEKDRTVLEVREEGEEREPWTWVRTHGKGRVFYTAWGHDERTWSHPGFQNLVERGIRWACGQDPAIVEPYAEAPRMNPKREDVQPFAHVEAKVPYYPAGRPWGTIGEPIRTMQAPLEPEESLKHMVTPAGFQPRLYASDPRIVKPIAMAWDERGRLFIAETLDYPNEFKPEGEGRDRIQVLEDTNGDGAADRFQVFADKLSLPTSIAFSRGGVIVHQPPRTLFLRDTNGDDVADERRVILDGWSLSDTHAGPSNLHYGFDNWMWGILGYAGFNGEAGGERHSFRQGFYRFRPDGSKLEFLRNTNNNSWGVGFSEEGIAFGSTANGNPSVHLPIASRYYERVRGWSTEVLGGLAGNPRMHVITDKIRQVDYHGAYTSAAGHALYTARVYPRELWNRTAFVCEPTGHIVAAFTLDPVGASFRSRNAWNLLASDDEWTAPIMAEVGPDGHVWVIDWYNYIVQHNPTPRGFQTGRGAAYETDLRDKKHGRIVRIVYEGAPPPKRRSLAGASPAELVEALRDDNLFWRRHAQRLLVERGEKDVVPALIAMVAGQDVDGIGLAPGVVHALWTLEGLGALDGSSSGATAAATAALRHPSASARRNAVAVLPRGDAGTRSILEAGLLADRDAQVRLATLLALAESPPSAEAAKAVADLLEEPRIARDRWLRDALTCAAAANDAAFLRTAAAGGAAAPGAQVLGLIERVAEHHARGRDATSAASLLGAISGAGPRAGPMVAGLARGWPEDVPVKLDETSERLLQELFEKLPEENRGRLAALAGRWGSRALEAQARAIAASFLAKVEDEKESDRSRTESARRFMDISRLDPEAPGKLLALAGGRAAPELASALIEAAGRSDVPATGAAIIEILASLTPAARSAAVKVLLGRAEWTRVLLAALDSGSLDAGDLTLDQKQALAAHPDRSLAQEARKVLARRSELPSPDRQAVLDELMPLASKAGDAARGKDVYTKQCARCHLYGTEGQKIGPDLTGIAVHPKAEVLSQIIDPNRSVEGTYRVYTAIAKDGTVVNGLLLSESRTALELVDTDAKKHAVQREDLEQLVASAKSLMPEGFEKQIPPEDMVNLLEFLVQRGKYLPLPLDKAATVVSTRGMFSSEESRRESLVFQDWGPKTFEGVPFHLVDPQGGRKANAILLHGPQGNIPPRMPRAVSLPCNAPAKAIHILGGVSGWGFPGGTKGSVSLIVRLHFEDGVTEDHPLLNGEHLADYNRRVDVPGSTFAVALRGRQLRCLAVVPKKTGTVKEIELVKGEDDSAPIVMAVTVETAAHP